jgi:type II secretory pathway component PulJ
VDDREFDLAVHDIEARRIDGRRTRVVTVVTIVAALMTALASNVVTVVLSNRGLKQAADQSERNLQQAAAQFGRSLQQTAAQFDRSRRGAEYDEIIDGLTTGSSAVQINSLRRLGRYVRDSGNFRDEEEQQAEAKTTLKTLAAFVKEKTGSTKDGLERWATPQQPAVGPALDQLNTLQGEDDLKTGRSTSRRRISTA